MSIDQLAWEVSSVRNGRYICFPHWEYLDFHGEWISFTQPNVIYGRGYQLLLPDGNSVFLCQVLSMDHDGIQYFLAAYTIGRYFVLLRNRLTLPTIQHDI
jgi:hypothetical protein